MAIYFAEVDASSLIENHIANPGATEAIVHYLLFASSIDLAIEKVDAHALRNY